MTKHTQLVGTLEPHIENIIPISKAENFEQAQAQHSYCIGEFCFTIDRAYADSCPTRSKFFYVDDTHTDSIFELNGDKGFTTPEGAARYVDKQVKQAAERLSAVASLFS